MQIFIL